MQSKLKLLSLIFASILMVACGSTDTKDDSDAATGADDNQDTSSQDGATVTGTGGDMAVDGADIDGADIEAAVEMLTVYYFDFDQSSLDADTREALDVVAAALKNTNVDVRLEGHADERGTREYNMALGERRANAIKNYLTVQGVSASRIEVISYGEEKPAMTGSDEGSWAKNRRVELVK